MNQNNPIYPVYIISKGRWESRLTSRALEKISVPYHIVVEPQEYDNYAAVIDPEKIKVLPFSNLSQGSIPARNWVWEDSIKRGFSKHWILDDNIRWFAKFNGNKKIIINNGRCFRKTEQFIDGYKNIALSGLQYEMFVNAKEAHTFPPILVNTRIYSCILINNSIPHRWRGRYNEDTDLSLRALKDGWCTILVQAYLCKKVATMRMKGGNTDDLYQGDGRYKMALSLQKQHPDVVKITRKWGRWQHHVDYRPFKSNRLIKNDGTPAGKEIPS